MKQGFKWLIFDALKNRHNGLFLLSKSTPNDSYDMLKY